MSNDSSGRRYLGLWLPFFTADRWRREQGSHENGGEPLVFVEKLHGTLRLIAEDQHAWRQGLRRGLSLADARARCPALRAIAFDRGSDEEFLAHLADLATTFTPSVALDEPNGLVLDITGSPHLFGGETGLVACLVNSLQSVGLTVCRIAVAPTPDMARALARFSQTSPCFADDDAPVRALPVAAFECSSEDTIALRRAGFKTIGDVADRPSLLFTARFTQDFTTKLTRILGEEDRRITPFRPLPLCRAEHRCTEPVTSQEVIERILAELAAAVSEKLRERGEGGRTFETAFLRSDGATRRIRIETSQPTRDPTVFMRLLRDRIDRLADSIDAGFGFDAICLQVLRSEPFEEQQSTLDGREEGTAQVTQLIDRLGAMFGRDRIIQLQPRDTHLPERVQIATSIGHVASASMTQALPSFAAFEQGPRPLFLFSRPQPIEIEANSEEPGEPRIFRWRRVVHHIVVAEGPERIADEWWRTPSNYGTRDYYRVESAEGRRFWIFRAEAAAASIQQKWFLHGLFP